MDTKVDTKFNSKRNNEVIVIEKYKFCQSNISKNNNTIRFWYANKKCGSNVF